MERGFKVFNKDWTCREFHYDVGQTYKLAGKLSLCNRGFHYCKKAVDCFNYYAFDSDNHVAEIMAHGEVLTDGAKSCTNNIEIVREIPWSEVLEIVNFGKNNTGHSNTGDSNTGNRNTGYSNTGDSNTGNRNTGHRNTGDSNTGNCNTGYSNTGDSNTGNRNTGDSNTGNRNTGHRNTGDYNLTNRSCGVFCKEPQKLKFFDVESDITFEQWRMSDAWYALPGELTMDWWNGLQSKEKEVIRTIPNFNEDKFIEIIKGMEKERNKK